MPEFKYRPEQEPEQPIPWSFAGVEAFMQTYGRNEGQRLSPAPCLRNLNELIEALSATPPQEYFGMWIIRLVEEGSPPPADAILAIDINKEVTAGTPMATIKLCEPYAKDWSCYEIVIAPEGKEYFGLKKTIGKFRKNEPTRWVTDEGEVNALASLVTDALNREEE